MARRWDAHEHDLVDSGNDSTPAQRGKPFISSWLDDLGLDPFAFRVYAHAWRRAGADGLFFGGGTGIARKCRMSLRQAYRALASLKAAGLLEVAGEAEPGKPTRYRPLPPDPCPTGMGTHATQARVKERPVPDRQGTHASQAGLPMPDRQQKVLPLKVLPEGTPSTDSKALVKRDNWPALMAQVWRPFGGMAIGRLGKALAGLIRDHGEERVADGLRRWLEAGNGRFGPESFAADAVRWINGRGRPAGGKAGGVDAQVGGLMEEANEARRQGK